MVGKVISCCFSETLMYTHVFVTTKGVKSMCNSSPKDQSTLCFLETPRTNELQKPPWEYGFFVMRFVQSTTAHIKEGEEKLI